MGQTLNLVLTVCCGVGWTLAYIFIILRSFRDKACGMPFPALALNISWEFIFSFILVHPGGIVQLTINWIWLFFDVLILVAWLRYGLREWSGFLDRRLFLPYTAFVLGVCGGFVYLFVRQFHDDADGGQYSAFILNLFMSMLFVSKLAGRNDDRGQSLSIAVCKGLGTLASTLCFVHQSRFIVFTGAGCFVLDTVYAVLLYKRRQAGMAVSEATMAGAAI